MEIRAVMAGSEAFYTFFNEEGIVDCTREVKVNNNTGHLVCRVEVLYRSKQRFHERKRGHESQCLKDERWPHG